MLPIISNGSIINCICTVWKLKWRMLQFDISLRFYLQVHREVQKFCPQISRREDERKGRETTVLVAAVTSRQRSWVSDCWRRESKESQACSDNSRIEIRAADGKKGMMMKPDLFNVASVIWFTVSFTSHKNHNQSSSSAMNLIYLFLEVLLNCSHMCWVQSIKKKKGKNWVKTLPRHRLVPKLTRNMCFCC